MVRAERRELRQNPFVGFLRIPARSALPDGLGKGVGRGIETLLSSSVSARPTPLCGDVECGTRQSRPWPSPSRVARIARKEDTSKATEATEGGMAAAGH